MTIYFMPTNGVLPADVPVPILDTGTLLQKLADAESAEGDMIVALTDKEVAFVAQQLRYLSEDLDACVLMDVTDGEYTSHWLLGAQLIGKKSSDVLVKGDRQRRAAEQSETEESPLERMMREAEKEDEQRGDQDEPSLDGEGEMAFNVNPKSSDE
jgi:hypothetical protein